jgi:DNA polymerase III delta' subunit
VHGAHTRGHGPALEAIAAMLRGGTPHAVLISGPAGIGKTTLALDLAAGLLCQAPDPAARPCRDCRGCRLTDAGTHPDLHWLRPEGKGGQIVIGSPGDPMKPRGVRDLLGELALMPLEGGARVAIIESAHRMNDDAQGALLKTLEEPPAGVTIILTADEETRLAPTIRSRCARIRLGPVAARDVEAILADQGVADAPLAARLARLVGGRPGVALTYARAPDALRIRGELVRVLLDLTAAHPAERLAAMRTAMPAALELVAALDAAASSSPSSGDPAGAVAGSGRGRAGGTRATRATKPPPIAAADPAPAAGTSGGDEDPVAGDGDPDEAEPAAKGPAASQRRRAAETIVLIWIEVARDLALVQAGGGRSVRDLALLEELDGVAAQLRPGAPAVALIGLERAATLLAANVSPELVLDATVLAWPVRSRAA